MSGQKDEKEGERKRLRARFSPNYRFTLMTVAQMQEVQRAHESNDLEYAFQTLRGQVATFGNSANISKRPDSTGVWELYHQGETCLLKCDEKQLDVPKGQDLVLIGLLVPRDDLENQPIVLELQKVIPLCEFVQGNTDQDRAKWFVNHAEKVLCDLMKNQ